MGKIIYTFLVLFIISVSFAFASDNVKIVTLTQIGEGKTKDEAKFNALRNALEQAFNTFISSNSTLLNDELIKDEIVSISSGNIQKFEILSETQLPNGSFSIVLKATVSIGNLTKFCESKGITVEFKGGLFAANIILQELNKKNEEKIFDNLYVVVEKIFEYGIFNFEIQVLDTPKNLTDDKDFWGIPLVVNAKFNSNLDKIEELLFSTINSISLNQTEVSEYQKNNVKTYLLNFNNKTYHLRNKESIQVLNKLFSKKLFENISKFTITNEICKTTGNAIFKSILEDYDNLKLNKDCNFIRPKNNFKFIDIKFDIMNVNFATKEWLNILVKGYGGIGYDDCALSFVNKNNNIFTFSIQNCYTLSELSKISGFKIEPIK